MRTIPLAAVVLLIAAPAAAKDPQPRTLYSGYDPSPAFPFGRLNPDAPPQTSQFAFMIGEFDCIDRRRRKGSDPWHVEHGKWNAAYYLNGMAILDRGYNETYAVSNVRIFDAKAGLWKVTYFSPGEPGGVWAGRKEGSDMVLKREWGGGDTPRVHSRLAFSHITPKSFEWVAEHRIGAEKNWTATWKISCTRAH
jgi:hypothetical protein